MQCFFLICADSDHGEQYFTFWESCPDNNDIMHGSFSTDLLPVPCTLVYLCVRNEILIFHITKSLCVRACLRVCARACVRVRGKITLNWAV